jgi:hypothetical protein
MHQFLKFYFGNETLHVSDSSSVHQQELLIVHSAMVFVVRVCRELSSRIKIEWAPSWSCCCSKAVNKPVWNIPVLNVQWITPDDGQRKCSKHVEFHFQNKIWEISAYTWFYYKENSYSVPRYWLRRFRQQKYEMPNIYSHFEILTDVNLAQKSRPANLDNAY